jgi:hypothetical protein
MIRSSVVLPQPLGPRMTSVSPSKIVRLRSSMRKDDRPPRIGTMSFMAAR